MRPRFIVLSFWTVASLGLSASLVHLLGGPEQTRAFLVAAGCNGLLVLFSMIARLRSELAGTVSSLRGVSLRPVVKMFGVILTCTLAAYGLEIDLQLLIPWMVACYLAALLVETFVLVRFVTRDGLRSGMDEV